MKNKRKVTVENWPYATWMAHRGGGKIAPENTLKGFQKGYQCGLLGAEFDVKLTQDNYTVVIHDDDLNRVAGINRAVKDLLLEEIRYIDAGINYPEYQPAYVPTLQEVANFCLEHNIGANVEIKPCAGREAETARLVAKYSLEYWQNSPIPPLFSSFSLESLKVVQELYPDSLRGLLLEDWLESDEAVIHHLKELDCVSLHADYKDLREERVTRIREAGFVVVAWTVNDIALAQELLRFGVSTIITDAILEVPKLTHNSR